MQRIQAALLVKAYGEGAAMTGIERMLESTNDNVRTISGAMVDAAGAMSELRQQIQDGVVDPAYDLGSEIAEAAQVVSNARKNKQKIHELLAQEAFLTQRSPLQNALIEVFAGSRSRPALT